MEYRRLGKSGLKVSEFSFGAWVTFGKQVDVDAAAKLIGTAYDAGVNFFDKRRRLRRRQSRRGHGRCD